LLVHSFGRPTGELSIPLRSNVIDDRGLIMPLRRRTRAQATEHRIATERRLNNLDDACIAAKAANVKPPPV
jgi:hypothetical protein